MVRLKASADVALDGDFMGFNSTMVRLKVLPEMPPEAVSSAFQFHYGTIKRGRRHTPYRAEGGFNSTMVRLKDRRHLV